eukprot:COSAG05_NODE_2586_length_2871_cov_21.775758_7_plen_109_part_01
MGWAADGTLLAAVGADHWLRVWHIPSACVLGGIYLPGGRATGPGAPIPHKAICAQCMHVCGLGIIPEIRIFHAKNLVRSAWLWNNVFWFVSWRWRSGGGIFAGQGAAAT